MKKFALSDAFLRDSAKKENENELFELFSALLQQNAHSQNHTETHTSDTADGAFTEKKDILAELYPQNNRNDKGKPDNDADELFLKKGYVDDASNKKTHSAPFKNETQGNKKGAGDYYSPPPYYGFH